MGLEHLIQDKITNLGNDTSIKLLKDVSLNYKQFTPHVNGNYHITMVGGTWKDSIKEEDIDAYGEFSQTKDTMKALNKKFHKTIGTLATDIDIPQLSLEYDSISGKSRSLNYVSRVNYASDFSINYIDDSELTCFGYHELWYKYIDALKKGYINFEASTHKEDTSKFFEVPNFNAVWVAIFKPFTTEINVLIKILGVSPINIPFKQIIGDRSKSSLTTLNINYKSNDMVFQIIQYKNNKIVETDFYNEYITDLGTNLA
jgi:hypothetical protein